MAFTILFGLFALAMIAVLLRLRLIAEGLFLLSLALFVAVFIHHITDKLAISL